MCIFCEDDSGNTYYRSQLSDAEIIEIEKCAELPERVPVTIVTGFLGAGKSTLLNRIFQGLPGKQFCVIQNEFGSIPVDDVLVKFENNKVITLSSGCLCCRVRGDLISGLVSIARTINKSNGSESTKLDGIVVETSGLSDVGPVAQTFFANSFVQKNFYLDAIVCVAETNLVHQLLYPPDESLQDDQDGINKDSPYDLNSATDSDSNSDSDDEDSKHRKKKVERILLEQLSYADIVLLNKVDLMENPETTSSCEKFVCKLNQTATTLLCTHSDVDISKIFQVKAFSAEAFLGNQHESNQKREDHDNAGHQGFGSVGLERKSDVDELRFTDWLWDILQKYGKKILRVKGVICFAGLPGWSSVQCVQSHIEINRLETKGEGKRISRLVFIGDIEAIESIIRNGFNDL